MGKPTQAPFGSWKSPLTSSLIVSETLQLSQIHLDGETLYWIENRPLEGGRNVIVQLSQTGEPISLTPTPFNVRSRVHEYGGGAYLVDNGVIYFSNFSDQRLYRHKADSKPQALTPEGQFYYADGVMDSQHNRIICIREDHSDSSREPVNSFISISLENPIQENAGQILASGCDFYSSPKISPDSRQLAWVSWNHPNMPWDGTQLWKANIELDGTLGKPECVAGGPQESIFQPEWSPDGTLFFISDRTGWWNLYRIRNGVSEALCPMEAEFDEPQWSLGLTTYTFESARTILCTYTKNGIWFLCRLDIECRTLETFPLPYTEIGGPVYLNGSTICTASSPSEPNVIIQIDLASYDIHILRRSINFSVEPHYLSIPQEIEFPTERGQTTHAFFYKPQNGDFSPPSGVKASLLVKSHGGPTGSASTAFNLMIQYWTSRGFAVLDVNYGGSTGYGRAYRERLNGQWGIVDVDDCVNGVRYVIKQGWVDDQKLTITGGSAGGYTTLSALTFRDCFTAGFKLLRGLRFTSPGKRYA